MDSGHQLGLWLCRLRQFHFAAFRLVLAAQ